MTADQKLLEKQPDSLKQNKAKTLPDIYST